MNNELNKEIEVLEQQLYSMSKIREESETLNNSLKACIELVSSSVKNPKITSLTERMNEENTKIYNDAYEKIQDTIKSNNDKLVNLSEERDKLKKDKNNKDEE